MIPDTPQPDAPLGEQLPPDPATVDTTLPPPDRFTSETATAATDDPTETDTAAVAAPDIKVGQLVSHTSFDPYIGAGGEEVTQVAVVLAVEDGQALVAFLPVSGPVPLDELEPGPELV